MLHDTSFWKKLNDHLLRHCRDRSTSLRHRSVDNLHHGQELHDLLHCAPLNPLLRPRLHESRGPTSSASISSSSSVKYSVLAAWGGGVVCLVPALACVEGCGVYSRPRPLRRSDVHDARTVCTVTARLRLAAPQHAVDIHDVHSLHLKTEERHKQGALLRRKRLGLLWLLIYVFFFLFFFWFCMWCLWVVVLLVLVLVVVVMVLT